MADVGMDLSFERADYAAGSGASSPCGNCQGPVQEQYWKWQTQILCAGCRDRMAGILEASQSATSLGRAALRGGAAALGCGIAYAVFVALTQYQLAIATIGIAFVIAKVVRKASSGIGGRRFQILAVVLTYLASAMGYAPGVWHAVKAAATHEPAPAVAPPAPAASGETPVPAPPDVHHEGGGKASVGGVVLAFLFLLAITLAAPVLEVTDAPLGLLIVLFGLWEAWKLSRGLPLTIEGPYRVGPAPPGPQAA